MDSSEIFTTAIYVATIYSTLNILIWVFYPTVTGILWQGVLGNFIASRWPNYSQSKEISRYSFMMEGRKGIVLKLGLYPAPIFELFHWIRDGFSIAVFFCIFPNDLMAALMVTSLMVWFTYRMITVGFSPSNFVRVDRFFASGREFLFMGALVYALASAGLLGGGEHLVLQ